MSCHQAFRLAPAVMSTTEDASRFLSLSSTQCPTGHPWDTMGHHGTPGDTLGTPRGHKGGTPRQLGRLSEESLGFPGACPSPSLSQAGRSKPKTAECLSRQLATCCDRIRIGIGSRPETRRETAAAQGSGARRRGHFRRIRVSWPTQVRSNVRRCPQVSHQATRVNDSAGKSPRILSRMVTARR